MRRVRSRSFLWIVFAAALGCGDCADSIHDDDPILILDPDFGHADLADGLDMDGVDSSNHGDMELDSALDLGNEDSGIDAESDSEISDAGDEDSDQDMDLPDDSGPSAECGNGVLEAGEACDDGNTQDGDYCSSDCQTITGSCGDGVLQDNEDCDFGPGSTCLGSHDGGLGTCVAQGTCSAGYELNGGQCVPQNNTGISTPCQNGPGQSLLRFSFSNNSTSPYIEVWNASCSYSLANQACNVVVVYPGFGSVSRTSEGYPILTSTHYIRARFSVAGLNFTQATLYVRGRSYSTGSSTQIRAWSPLYGDAFGGPVDNDFIYDWYPIDWSSYLDPGDNPNLTAFQLYAYQGSNSLAVRAVELCLE